MLKGHHGVCGERGEGRETDRLGIEQTSVAMSRHVAGDTDGRNSAGRRSFDCLQSPPRPSLAHRRRTRLGAAARRTVRVSQSCWGFRGLLDGGRESVPHLRRRPTPSRGPQRQVQRADPRRVPGNARRATAPPRQGRQGVPHRVGAASGHRPGPVVHRRFDRAVDEGQPGGADTKGTTAGPATTNGPSADEHSSEAASADAA